MLVDVVSEAGDELPGFSSGAYGGQGEFVPAGFVGRVAVLQRGQGVMQEAAAVLGHAEEAGAAAEEPCGDGSLYRVGG